MRKRRGRRVKEKGNKERKLKRQKERRKDK